MVRRRKENSACFFNLFRCHHSIHFSVRVEWSMNFSSVRVTVNSPVENGVYRIRSIGMRALFLLLDDEHANIPLHIFSLPFGVITNFFVSILAHSCRLSSCVCVCILGSNLPKQCRTSHNRQHTNKYHVEINKKSAIQLAHSTTNIHAVHRCAQRPTGDLQQWPGKNFIRKTAESTAARFRRRCHTCNRSALYRTRIVSESLHARSFITESRAVVRKFRLPAGLTHRFVQRQDRVRGVDVLFDARASNTRGNWQFDACAE